MKYLTMTRRRVELLEDWIARYDIQDYVSNRYPDKVVFIGISSDGHTYKKIIR
jgi:hypothetical protein